MSRLFEFITSILTDQSLDFQLSIPPNLPIENVSTKNLIDSDIAPKSVLNVRFPSQKEQFFQEIFDVGKLMKCSPSDADKISSEW